MITDFKNKKIAILGLGVEGVATAKFLAEKGGKIWILDNNKKENIDQEFLTSVEKIAEGFICGENYLETLSDFDMIVRSPGVRRLTPELLEAEEKGVIITSQIKLFFDLCPAKIIGVTGTKGKGTTSSLIYEMLKESGKDVYLGGNIGVAPLDFLPKLTGSSWVVLELSSFQLQDLEKSPHIAVMLMVTSEHLDHHKTTEEYIDAKRNLLRFQTPEDFAVINRDYPASNESDILTEGKVFYFSRERETNNGCFALNGKVILRVSSVSKVSKVSKALDTPGTLDTRDTFIINTSNIFIPGKHNYENVCAAVMAATLAGVGKDAVVKVLKTFKGLEHRLEFVREINGVKYYDDSFSTIPETTIAAIEAFEAPEILILGGSSKHSDFSKLGIVIREAKNIKAIIGIGSEWEEIKSQFPPPVGGYQFPIIEDLKNMKEIVAAAAKIAKPGDVVLLSPACASFDMFKNYKLRGEEFKKEVSLLV